VGAYARARVTFKAARFRAPVKKGAGLVQLRAALRCPFGAAFERAALARGHWCPTKPHKVHGFNFTSKGHHMSKSTTNRPSHRVYAVTKNGERNFWQPIGAAWAHGDGEGFNLKLDYLPLNGAEIVIRKSKAGEADTAAAA